MQGPCCRFSEARLSNMHDVMTPPANCAMSDKFSKYSRAVEDLRSESGASGIESRVEMPLSARGSRRTSSEASFASGLDREPPLSARSSRTYSVASVDGFRPNRATSEASFASSSGYSDLSHSEIARKHHSNRRGGTLPTCAEEAASDVSDMCRSRRSDACSEASSWKVSGASRRMPTARSSCASDAMSTISESTVCSTSERRPASVCSSGSFSFGGFSMDKAQKR